MSFRIGSDIDTAYGEVPGGNYDPEIESDTIKNTNMKSLVKTHS